ncbi:MAG: DUF1611 domain-containing protein [Mycobacterium sp.]|nr:DUF1611 domain-containing protein [Mycobacterium sp.]
MPEPAIVLADGCFREPRGKVAHGLVRGGDRFTVRAVVDHTLAGRDAGAVLDGSVRGIPIVTDVAEAIRSAPEATVAIVGEAPHGGRLTEALRIQLRQCAAAGLNLVSGLHDLLCDDPELSALAAAKGSSITDVRRTPPARELRFWDGSVYAVRAKRISVLGTDCMVGKRTTARMLTDELNRRGYRTEMIYTGQTGWMQGNRYGIVYDALIADFNSGELEGAIVACANDIDPDVMVIEGQGSLRNPSGPCGADLILSAAVSGVVLQHAPARSHFHGLEHLEQCRLPSLASEIELIRQYGAAVLAVVLNLTDVAQSAGAELIAGCRTQCGGVPVIEDLLGDGAGGVEALADLVADALLPEQQSDR